MTAGQIPRFIHVHAFRLASGKEALVARVVAPDGKVGFGFSLSLDATEARHMAEWSAGLRKEIPELKQTAGHPWEKAWRAGKPVPWDCEEGFSRLKWLP
jgi:hypothetical protein